MALQKYYITDNDASLTEVITTTGILVVILLFCDLYFHFSWTVTFSICIFYSTFVIFVAAWVTQYFGLQFPGSLN